MPRRPGFWFGAAAAVVLIGVVALAFIGHYRFSGPFAPERWIGPGGQTANPHHGAGPEVPFERSTCSGSAPSILFRNGTYLRDPKGELASMPTQESYSAESHVPEDAAYTGWHRGSEQLWFSRSDLNADGVHLRLYVVWPDHAERLPLQTFGCA